MHTKDARAASETEERIYLLDAWREAPFYTEEERLALELTEAVTLISQAGVPDELYQRVRARFDEQRLWPWSWPSPPSTAGIGSTSPLATWPAATGHRRSTRPGQRELVPAAGGRPDPWPRLRSPPISMTRPANCGSGRGIEASFCSDLIDAVNGDGQHGRHGNPPTLPDHVPVGWSGRGRVTRRSERGPLGAKNDRLSRQPVGSGEFA
jgi:hypothetical protein